MAKEYIWFHPLPILKQMKNKSIFTLPKKGKVKSGVSFFPPFRQVFDKLLNSLVPKWLLRV